MKKGVGGLMSCLIMLAGFVLFSNAHLWAQNAKICVISDPHYMDPDLVIQDGPAIQAYMVMEIKLIMQSEAILESALDSIVAESPDVLLIPGDLTKDGEFASHTKMAAFLQDVENAGIKVFVIPGNHDINNPYSFAYDSNVVIPVPSVTATQFETIYGNFGFDEALYRDPNSLSYVAEPIPGYWLLALDASQYAFNTTEPIIGGQYSEATLDWIKQKLLQAKATGKIVIGMQHHLMMEHYMLQKVFFADYVLDDWENVSNQLADYGMKLVFSGHNHCQDIIARNSANGNPIFDIETASLVQYPCPYRIVNISGDSIMNIEGEQVTDIDYNLNGVPFLDYALAFEQYALPFTVNYMLQSPPYSLPPATVSMIEPAVSETMLAHFAGDEGDPSPQTQGIINYMFTTPMAPMAYTMSSIWNDAAPGDWTASIPLLTQDRQIEGHVFYNNTSSSPIPNALCYAIDCYGNKQDSAITDNDGYYKFTFLPAGSYHIKAQTDLNWGGANATDALLIGKHFTNLQTLTGLYNTAADVNLSSYVNTTDAFYVAKRFVGLINSFPMPDWVCDDDALTLDTSLTHDFHMLCAGDVNGDFTPASAKIKPGLDLLSHFYRDARPGEELVLDLNTLQSLQPGAISLVMNYPTQYLDIVAVEKADPQGELIFSATDGMLRIAWFSLEGIQCNENKPFLKIRVSVKTDAPPQDLNFSLGAESVFADNAGNPIDDVTVLCPKISVGNTNSEVKISVFPNPFRSTVNIRYSLEKDGIVKLLLLNSLGEEVMTVINESQTMGQHSVVIDAGALDNGIYYGKLDINGYTEQIKLLVIR
jgi:3',5'-cyclic AMP phosphodiesterase CpdA